MSTIKTGGPKVTVTGTLIRHEQWVGKYENSVLLTAQDGGMVALPVVIEKESRKGVPLDAEVAIEGTMEQGRLGPNSDTAYVIATQVAITAMPGKAQS